MALNLVRIVAERKNPLSPIRVGELAELLPGTLPTVSRLCTELESLGMLEKTRGYGTYRLGRRARRLSGTAAAPFAGAVRLGLITLAQQTGETVYIAAPSKGGVRVIDVIDSGWTLHAPVELGDLITDKSSGAWRAGYRSAKQQQRRMEHFESSAGLACEIAIAIRDSSANCVAVMAARFPASRSSLSASRVRRALHIARRHVEDSARDAAVREPQAGGGREKQQSSPLSVGLQIFEHVARHSSCSLEAIAEELGLRKSRVQRLVEASVTAGVLRYEPRRAAVSCSWVIHAWYRGSIYSLLRGEGQRLVAAAANTLRASVFLTVLVGMRSLTLVEAFGSSDDGLAVSSWLNRLHPLIGSDGGAALVVDLELDDIRQLFPSRYGTEDIDGFLEEVARTVAAGVNFSDLLGEEGLVSVSAPVRDRNGLVVAAACLVVNSDRARWDKYGLQNAVRDLAADLSEVLA